MSKQITKIELDGKPSGTKPLMMSDNLTTIREKIKDRVNASYIFLDKDGYPINKEDEKDYLLENISVSKLIKLKSDGSATGIDIFFNNTKICSANCSLSQNLSEVRNLISQYINQEFLFLIKQTALSQNRRK